MKLEDFLGYSGLRKVKGCTGLSYARGLIGSLISNDSPYYYKGIRRVKDMYTLTARDVFLEMKGYGVKTVEGINKILTKNNLPPTSICLEDISCHPYYSDLRWSQRRRKR